MLLFHNVYTNITELSTVMLNELVERVEVHARSQRYTKGTQQIDIVFNYVGNIEEVQEKSAENETKG
jgi:hypothetical protein